MDYYSVILLDDEELIIQSLRKMISWSDLNCYICASANSGEKGKELIDEACPDILIADIKMPGMSGLDLAEYCAARYPCCKVIIVSAYEDFSFAQKAIKAGTVDYLLKPIDKQDLMEAIRRAIGSIQEWKEAAQRLEKEKVNLENVRTLAEDNILFNLARYGTVGIRGELLQFVMDRARHPGVVIMIEFFNLTKAQTTVMAIGQEFYGNGLLKAGYHPAFGSADEKVVMICPVNNRCDHATGRLRIIHTLREIQHLAPEEAGLNVICVSDIYRNEEELQKSYRQCIAMSGQAFFCGQSRILVAVENNESGKKENKDINVSTLLQALKNGQKEVMDNFFAFWKKQLLQLLDKQLSITKIREFQREITLFAFHMEMDTSNLWRHPFENGNFASRYQVLTEGASSVFLFALKHANPVDKCALYLEEHYFEHDLSLEKVAEAVQVNSSYLSRAFKKKYHVNFSEYLKVIRIEHAKRLLETSNRKTYEIADQIGYEDAHYFSQVFKKKTGMSPLEYRQESAAGRKITT